MYSIHGDALFIDEFSQTYIHIPTTEKGEEINVGVGQNLMLDSEVKIIVILVL